MFENDSIKGVIRPLLRPLVLYCLQFFFDKKYLSGHYFEENYIGFRWALRSLWQRNVLRLAPPYPWPVSLTCVISDPSRIHFSPNDLNIFQTQGTYFQNFDADIRIGAGVYIAQNVGIITANHSLSDLDAHEPGREIVLGDKCWIGMNSVILPGVVLGASTIVGAGSVVTKSFPQGAVVIAGVPAVVIKNLEN